MQPRCVVLVCTDQDTEDSVRAVLGPKLNARVQVVRDPGMARARIAAGDVDVVLVPVSYNRERGVSPAEFGDLCEAAGPPVIALCSKADEALGHSAVGAGADTYALREDLSDLPGRIDVAVSERARRRRRGQLVAVLGSKGGVGASTLALNLAAALAQDRSVILAELRSGTSTFHSHLCPHRSVRRLSDIPLDRLWSEQDLASISWSPHQLKSLQILFGPAEPGYDLRPEAVRWLTKSLHGLASVTVVDLGLPSWDANVAVLQDSEVLTLVVERDCVSVQAAKDMLDAIDARGATPRVTLITVVQRAPAAFTLPISDIETALKRRVALVAPPSPEVCFASQNNHLPTVLSSPETLLAETFFSLARAISDSIRASESRGAEATDPLLAGSGLYLRDSPLPVQ